MTVINDIEKKRRHREHQRNYVIRQHSKGLSHIAIWMKVKKQNVPNLRSALVSLTGEEIIRLINNYKQKKKNEKKKENT